MRKQLPHITMRSCRIAGDSNADNNDEVTLKGLIINRNGVNAERLKLAELYGYTRQ